MCLAEENNDQKGIRNGRIIIVYISSSLMKLGAALKSIKSAKYLSNRTWRFVVPKYLQSGYISSTVYAFLKNFTMKLILSLLGATLGFEITNEPALVS